MVFLILNAIVAVALIVSSFAIDAKKVKGQENTPLVNSILFLSALFLFMALTIGLCFFAPQKLAYTIGKTMYLLMGWFCVNNCMYMLCFPAFNKTKPVYAVQWALNIVCLIIIFMVKGSITNISITSTNSFQLASNLMFAGRIGRALMIDWFTFYEILFVFFLPLFCSVMVLVRAENSESVLDRQKNLIVISGVFASLIIFSFIKYSSIYQPMLRTLIFVSFIPELIAFLYAERINELWDKKLVLREGLKFIVKYFFPALLIGLFFTFLWPLFSRSRMLFFPLFIASSVFTLVLWHYAGKFISNKGLMRDSRYASNFADGLSAITFDKDPKIITKQLFDLFNNYVDSSSMKILVDSGDNYLQYVYDSTDDDEEHVAGRNIEMPAEMFDKLQNLNRHVVFRESVYSDYGVAAVKNAIIKFLDALQSDAFLLLSEGRHITGLIALGKKSSRNVYNDYDYKVFNDLYSNFFVIGYYMKNIMNESVVGTVNREIKMSGQIITSIQENMDRIKSDKVDVGYLMHPAHNIGGEFVDTIRLTSTRYIYIIGSLSGKGIAASMNMVILKSIIRTYLSETSDFKMLVVKVNSFIRESLPKGTIFSGIFGLVDFDSDTMYYINCGAPALFLYTQAYNNIIEIQGDGRVLGFARDLSTLIKVKKVKLSPGDIVFACTDGLVNTKSLRGEKFGKARIQNELLENRSFPSERIPQFMYESLTHFASTELEDDVTIFMMKYLVSGGNE